MIRGRFPATILMLLVMSGAAGKSLAGDSPDESVPQAESNRRMSELLDRVYRSADPTGNYMLNLQRAKLIHREIAASTSVKETLFLRVNYARELLFGGETEEAISEFEAVIDYARDHGADLGTRNHSFIRRNLAICYLRLGEQENCILKHNIESCLLPISGEGVHTVRRGSRKAIELLSLLLEERPDDLEARWLLNIAHMTLGEYPDKVRPEWLVPSSVFDSEYPVKKYREVAGVLGLDTDGLAGGSIVEDFDRDGFLDVMASSSRLTGPLKYFQSNGDGTFTDRTGPAGLTGQVGSLNMVPGDYNNDGFIDVLMLRGGWLGDAGRHPNSLLRNNGDGTFTDVTVEAGLLSFHPTQTATWFDYDNDGMLDLFVGNETGGDYMNPGKRGENHPAELFRNNGDGTFTECAAAAGVAIVGYVKAVVSGDYDNDGWPDLYLSLRDQPNLLFRNSGFDTEGGCGRRFADVSTQAGVTEPIHGFPAWFWDYDNDGWLDIFVAGYAVRNVGDVAADYLGLPHPGELSHLFRNKGDGTFEDVSKQTGLNRVILAMGSNFGDIDNDGYLDFYVGTGDPSLTTLVPNRLFRNDQGRFFHDVTTGAGMGHLQKGHGVSFADIDNDGDQDVYHCLGGAFWGDSYRNALFENPGYGNHWITLKLEGVESNRAALGARIGVTVETPSGEQTFHRMVGPGGSFGASPVRQEIGLGPATRIRSVAVLWPGSNTPQMITGLAMNSFYAIRQNQEQPLKLSLRSVELASPAVARTDHRHHDPGM